MKKPKPLSPKIMRFIAEYLVDQNGTQAAIRAGYSRRTSQEQSSRLLSNVIIRAEVDRRMEEIYERNSMTRGQIVQELSRLGDADIADITDEEGRIRPLRAMPVKLRRAIKSIKRNPDGTVEFSFWDKNTALTTLAKIRKMLSDKTEVELSGKFIVEWGGSDAQD